MITQKAGRTAFLAGPFKAIVDSATGLMSTFDRGRYEALIGHLELCGYTVHNAHKRESWGANFLPPEECTRLDYEQIRESDLFVAFPGSPASPGTHIEIGWATALGKPVILLLEAGHTYAYLVQGLHTVGNVRYVSIPAGETGLTQFASALDELRVKQNGYRRAGLAASGEKSES